MCTPILMFAASSRYGSHLASFPGSRQLSVTFSMIFCFGLGIVQGYFGLFLHLDSFLSLSVWYFVWVVPAGVLHIVMYMYECLCAQVRETVLSEEQERKLLERILNEEEDERDVSGHVTCPIVQSYSLSVCARVDLGRWIFVGRRQP